MDVYVVLGMLDHEGEYTVAVEATLEDAKDKAADEYADAHALEQWALGGVKVARWVRRGMRGDWVEDMLRC